MLKLETKDKDLKQNGHFISGLYAYIKLTCNPPNSVKMKILVQKLKVGIQAY
jgi:hypothetical protein